MSRLFRFIRKSRFVIVLPLFLALAGPTPARAQASEPIKAPELDGAVGYLGSDRPIKLKDLHGKIVILDFWTLC